MSRFLFFGACHVAVAVMFWVSDPTPAAGDDANEEQSLAELPHWPVGLRLPEELTVGWKRRERMYELPEAHILVWTPTRQIRAVRLITNNTDSKIVGQHVAVREVARLEQIGIVYLRPFDGGVVERSDPPADAEETFAAVLDLVAAKTGVAEYRHAPWITFGKSSRGRFPFRTTWCVTRSRDRSNAKY